MGTPELTDTNGNPANSLLTATYTNHVVAYVRSISGPAVEKPPQDNPIIQSDAFGYRIFCVNALVATTWTRSCSMRDNVSYILNGQPTYSKQLAANLHELRLTFLWPQLPNGKLGIGRQTYRALIGGQIATNLAAGNILYFYQPQSFGYAP